MSRFGGFGRPCEVKRHSGERRPRPARHHRLPLTASSVPDTSATSCPPRQPRYARSGRTNVGSRATSSLSISPCCDTGERQCGQIGLARCMNGPAHPRHSAECPHSLNLKARGADMHTTHSRSTVSGASAGRRCDLTSTCSRSRASGTVMRRALFASTRPIPILCSSIATASGHCAPSSAIDLTSESSST